MTERTGAPTSQPANHAYLVHGDGQPNAEHQDGNVDAGRGQDTCRVGGGHQRHAVRIVDHGPRQLGQFHALGRDGYCVRSSRFHRAR